MIQRIVIVFLAFIAGSERADALHGNPAFIGNIAFCESFIGCSQFPLSSQFFGQFHLRFDNMGNEIDEINTFEIYVDSSPGSGFPPLFSSDNGSVLFENFTTFTDEFEQTTFIGGTLTLETNALFASFDSTTFFFDFDADFLDIYLGPQLIASTRLVPLPATVWLLAGSLLLLRRTRRSD